MKRCRDCNRLKPLDEFHRRSDARDGYQSRCKKCNVARVLQWRADNPERFAEANDGRRQRLAKHGFTVAEFDSIVAEQDGKCPICRLPKEKLVVDHDHQTDLVRGIICDPCNRGLGAFRDNPAALRAAADYLEAPPLLHLGKRSRHTHKSKRPHGWKPNRRPRAKSS